MKPDREKIRNMFDGCCAYCGKSLDKVFHIDHVKPIYRGYKNKPKHSGEDEEDNMFPACPRCNIWKRTWEVEDFRNEISLQIDRLRRDSAGFRLAEDFGIIEMVITPVVFWFEKYKPEP